MRKLAIALSFLLLSSHAFALDVAGVNVAPTVSSHQKTLTLNGAASERRTPSSRCTSARSTRKRSPSRPTNC